MSFSRDRTANRPPRTCPPSINQARHRLQYPLGAVDRPPPARSFASHAGRTDGGGRAAPAKTWSEAAAKAQYLIELFAATPEAQDPRRKELTAHALDDLNRLCDHAKEKS